MFNFSKVIPMDRQAQGSRRRLLSKVLFQDGGQDSKSKAPNKMLTFNLVSEPDESEGDEGKCEDVGSATVDLEAMYKSGKDLVDAVLDVTSAEPETRLSKFLGSKKTIGTLTVSVIATEVFKTLQK